MALFCFRNLAVLRRTMAGKADELIEMLSPTVEALGLELLGVEFAQSGNGSLLRLYIDVEGRHVAIEDCEAVSREVSALLDVNDPISSNYTLEVSSPGIDRPLFSLKHFERFLGEEVKVSLRLPQAGRRRVQGRIAKIDGETVTIAEENVEYEISFDNIEKAKLVPDFVALGLADPKKPAERGPRRRKASPSDKPKA
jgi:ribosome maturation factor RimP